MAFGGGGGSSAIGTSTDVFMSGKANDDILVYNASTVKWNNKPLVGTVALASGGGVENVHAVTAAGATAINLAQGNVFNVTVTAASTLTFSGAQANKACSFSLYVRQDATGGHAVNWGSTVKWSGGAPTSSTGANAIDIFVFESIDGGTTWFGSLVGTNFV